MTPQEARNATGYGFKLLDPTGATYRDGVRFGYHLPAPGEKWSEWTRHPEPAEFDGKDSGPGRIHLMRRIDARYADRNWWPWFAQWTGLVGASDEKLGVVEVRLRLIEPRVFWRIIRMGWCTGADLSGANLRGASLRGASLSDADLSLANLSLADLSGANLRGANLRGANLTGANLRGASLSDADLSGANLSWAVGLDGRE